MKSIAMLMAGTALLWNPAPCLADEASKAVKIEEMMRLTHVDRMMGLMLDQMKSMVAAQMDKMDMPADARQASGEMQQKIMALVADRMMWDKVKPAYIKIYSETFSEETIDGILAFYKSPAGQVMLEKMPELMQKSMTVGQQLVGDVTPEIQRMMEEMKKKYKQ